MVKIFIGSRVQSYLHLIFFFVPFTFHRKEVDIFDTLESDLLELNPEILKSLILGLTLNVDRLKNLRRRVNNVENFRASKAYKKCINKQYKTKYVNKLRNLRNSDPKAYWKLLNKFDGSRTTTAQKLSLDAFAEHFKKLNTISSDNNTLPLFDLTNVSEHNLEINSPITEQEVLKSINCLKSNKKVQVGKDQEKAQSEKDSHSKNRGGKKPN